MGKKNEHWDLNLDPFTKEAIKDFDGYMTTSYEGIRNMMYVLKKKYNIDEIVYDDNDLIEAEQYRIEASQNVVDYSHVVKIKKKGE